MSKVASEVEHETGTELDLVEHHAPNKLPSETAETIKAFYNQDDISRQCPGQKDYVTIRNENSKERVQEMHMTITVKEAHSIFLNEKSDIKVEHSTFASLSPMHDRLSS